jgi:hypothetical protein
MRQKKKETTMSTTPNRESARIYTFPTQAQREAGTRRERTSSVVSIASRRIADIAFGGAWYHEAAIAEEKRNVKR